METHQPHPDPSLAAWLRGDHDQERVPASPPPIVGMPLLEGGDGSPDSRPRRRLPAFAAIVWVLALALAVISLSDVPVRPPRLAAAPGGARGATAAAPADPAPVDPVAADVGALLVRAALSATAGDAAAARYVDDAVATDAEVVGDVTVVTVLAVVLEGGDRGWERASVERYGIAVRAGAAVAGPWLLPAAGAVAAHQVAPVEDPGLRERAATALAAAGYQGVASVALTRDPGLPGVLLARFHAGAPGSHEQVERTALLRDGPEPSVLGAGL
jgi:hypothetical protein